MAIMICTRWAAMARLAATARTRTSPTGEPQRAGDPGAPPPLAAAGGFTLLELLIVLVLLAVVGAIAGSRVMGTLDRPRVEAAAGELAAMLRRARSRAIVDNAPVAVRIDVQTPTFALPGEAPYRLPDRLTLRVFTAVSEARAASIGEIRFFPDGSSTGGEVTVTGEHARQYVQVEWLTGRVAVYDR